MDQEVLLVELIEIARTDCCATASIRFHTHLPERSQGASMIILAGVPRTGLMPRGFACDCLWIRRRLPVAQAAQTGQQVRIRVS